MPKGIPKNGVNKGWIKKGLKLPENWVANMKGNKNRLGHKHSQEARKKMRKNHKGFLGKKHSEETKSKSRGEKNHIWKGESACYTSKHQWVARILGSPKYCEHCKRSNKKKYEWANKDHLYKRVIKDYMRLCTSCHRIYDIKNGLWKKKKKFVA